MMIRARALHWDRTYVGSWMKSVILDGKNQPKLRNHEQTQQHLHTGLINVKYSQMLIYNITVRYVHQSLEGIRL